MFVCQPVPARGTPQQDRLLGHRGRRISSGVLAVGGAQSIITRMFRLIGHTPFPPDGRAGAQSYLSVANARWPLSAMAVNLGTRIAIVQGSPTTGQPVGQRDRRLNPPELCRVSR